MKLTPGTYYRSNSDHYVSFIILEEIENCWRVIFMRGTKVSYVGGHIPTTQIEMSIEDGDHVECPLYSSEAMLMIIAAQNDCEELREAINAKRVE